ncbi:MAG: hypothetical protein IKL51_00970 [Lachnospiraceae bacterium]|nr:hypothetical protein [Lachnospiraceae bacterium]
MFFIFQYQYSIIGPELRQAILLQELIKEESCIFYDVKKEKEEYFLVEDKRTRAKRAEDFEEAVTGAQNLLFPIPFCKGNRINLSETKEVTQEELLQLLSPGQKLFAGVIGKDFVEKAKEKGVICYDYMTEERIAVFNSIATAEGTIGEILHSFPYNLHGTPVLVLGYGRCAKTLVRKLKALDAKIAVYARRKDASMEAYAQGAEPIEKGALLQEMKKYPLVINTIPERIFRGEEIKQLSLGTIIYEIASYPYCMDPKEAEEFRVKFRICSGLPGKYSPLSSAIMLKEYITGEIMGED